MLNSVEDINDPSVLDFLEMIKKAPYQEKKILLIVQCSKQKPYSHSASHRWILNAIKNVTDLDPVHDYDRLPIEILVISSLIGPVPYQFQYIFPANDYNLSVNKMTKKDFDQVREILVNRIADFLRENSCKYEKIIAMVKNRYLTLLNDVKKKNSLKIESILKRNDVHIVREGWLFLESCLLKKLTPRISLNPLIISKFYRMMEIISFQKTTNQEELIENLMKLKMSHKQALNQIFTLKNLGFLQKISTNELKIHDSIKSNDYSFDIKEIATSIIMSGPAKYLVKNFLFHILFYKNISFTSLARKMKLDICTIKTLIELTHLLKLVHCSKHKLISLTKTGLGMFSDSEKNILRKKWNLEYFL